MSKITGIGINLFAFFGSAFRSQKPVSDHYNGKKFFNPTLKEQFSPGLLDIYKLFKGERAKWPEKVENKGTPRMNEKLRQSDISLTFINHATFLIQMQNMNILTDPVWSERASPMSWFGPKRVRRPGVAMEDLPGIDLILISHNHYDHLDIKTLKKLNERFSPKVLVPIGDKGLIESIGIKNVQELDWWDSVQIDSRTRITFTPAQHSSARGLFDKDESLWGSYFIQHRKRSIYFGGDGGYSTHFEDIQKRMGVPEFAILGIGAYSPRSFMKPIHMDPADAVKAHRDLGAKQSIGMHFGTFQLSSEAIDQPQKDLKEALEKAMLSPDSFIVLKEGETKIYKAASE